ncbi:NfeD family protein [Heyndrickxia camelliae]|uniref:Nodulation efficiency protein NfeD n=1 Tax=Heyndrickxia camelliae TaxID=1707093 RepID=A0A2N3LKQ3_9BACI|nr:NfeD family protein [Heyndrickxia camelliae]PKR85114.1 nodulation efficiency protein NfeD [Heyndrickxia camelliae]
MRKQFAGLIGFMIFMLCVKLPVHAAMNQEITVAPRSPIESFADFLTNPIVVTILLCLASLGLVLELYTPRFGLYGIVGIIALVLFYFSHIVTGDANFSSLILFVLGVVLIIAELFLPGAIAGFLGVLAIIGSLLMAGGNLLHTGISIIIALLITIIAMIIMIKVFGRRMKLFKKIVLQDSVSTEKGYVSNKSRIDLLDKIGKTITPLRPAGTIDIEGERLDVVTEGGFIAAGVYVKVIKVEGVRIIVRLHQN